MRGKTRRSASQVASDMNDLKPRYLGPVDSFAVHRDMLVVHFTVEVSPLTKFKPYQPHRQPAILKFQPYLHQLCNRFNGLQIGKMPTQRRSSTIPKLTLGPRRTLTRGTQLLCPKRDLKPHELIVREHRGARPTAHGNGAVVRREDVGGLPLAVLLGHSCALPKRCPLAAPVLDGTAHALAGAAAPIASNLCWRRELQELGSGWCSSNSPTGIPK